MKAFFKILFTLSIGILTYFVLLSCRTDPPDGNSGGGGLTGNCSGEVFDDVFFRVVNVSPIAGWCNWVEDPPCNGIGSCLHTPNDDYYQLDNLRDLQKLTFDSYTSDGTKNYWFQYGGDGRTYCADDETGDFAFNCLRLEEVNISCPQVIWIQLVTECDLCVNGQQGGAWWKWEQNFGPNELPVSTCGGMNAISNISLILQSSRTNCPNLDDRWGCGEGKIQE